jgi:hypothetical protein
LEARPFERRIKRRPDRVLLGSSRSRSARGGIPIAEPCQEKTKVTLPNLLSREAPGLAQRSRGDSDTLLTRPIRFAKDPSASSTERVKHRLTIAPRTGTSEPERELMDHVQVCGVRHPYLAKWLQVLLPVNRDGRERGDSKVLQEHRRERSHDVRHQISIPRLGRDTNVRFESRLAPHDSPRAGLTAHSHERDDKYIGSIRDKEMTSCSLRDGHTSLVGTEQSDRVPIVHS